MREPVSAHTISEKPHEDAWEPRTSFVIIMKCFGKAGGVQRPYGSTICGPHRGSHTVTNTHILACQHSYTRADLTLVSADFEWNKWNLICTTFTAICLMCVCVCVCVCVCITYYTDSWARVVKLLRKKPLLPSPQSLQVFSVCTVTQWHSSMTGLIITGCCNILQTFGNWRFSVYL